MTTAFLRRSTALARHKGTQIRKIFFLPFFPSDDLLRVLTHLIANGRVYSVAWSPDGTKIASGSNDTTVKVWKTQTGQCASSLSLDSGPWGVYSVAYSPAGDMIAAGCSNGKIHLVDTVTVAVKRSFNCHSDW